MGAGAAFASVNRHPATNRSHDLTTPPQTAQPEDHVKDRTARPPDHPITRHRVSELRSRATAAAVPGARLRPVGT